MEVAENIANVWVMEYDIKEPIIDVEEVVAESNSPGTVLFLFLISF